MAEEVRRSGRATKGQHTKNVEAADSPPAKRARKGNRSKPAKRAEASPPPEDEADAIIRCICGYVEEDEDDDRVMIICDNCEAWQHNECMEVSENAEDLPDQYFCERCKPEDHKDLLAKVARGEKPWEERAKQRELEEAERKSRRRKGGKRGKRGRASDVKVDVAKANGSPVSTPVATPQVKPVVASSPVIPPFTAPPPIPVPVTPVSEPQPTSRPENSQKRKLPIDSETSPWTADQQEPSNKLRKISSPVEAKTPSIPSVRGRSGAHPPPSRGDSKGVGFQTELVENISDLQSDARRRVASALVKLFVEQTEQAEKQGAFSRPSGQTRDDLGLKLGLAVEYAIYLNFWGTSGEPSSLYAEKFRTISHNVKKNSALRDRLLSGLLSPNEFSKMSSHDMASKELQEKTAEMKREAEKQHVIIQEEGPRIRRTHKGDEIVGEDSHHTIVADQVYSQPIVRRRDTEGDSAVSKPAGEEPTTPYSPIAVESPEKITYSSATFPPPAPALVVDTKTPRRPSTASEPKPSATFNIQDVWSSVTGPDSDKQRAKQPPQHTESENVPVGVAEAPTVVADAEIDHLLKDEDPDEEEPYSPTDYAADPDAPVWRGKMTMVGVAEFGGVGKHVAGANLSATYPWSQLIPSLLTIEGRIDVERATTYLCGLRFSNTCDVSVVCVTPNDGAENRAQFDKLFDYFTDRKRYGVIAKTPFATVKDTYLVPVEIGISKKPDFIELLEHCTIEEPNPERMMLLTFVIRSNNTPSAQATPRHPDSAVIAASPINHSTVAPGSNAMSPLDRPPLHRPPLDRPPLDRPPPPFPIHHPHAPHGLPTPGPSYPPPPQPPTGPRGMEAARQALGDLANSPSVGQLLVEAPNTGVVEFQIVKGLLERVPATRADYAMLTNLLSIELQQQGGAPTTNA